MSGDLIIEHLEDEFFPWCQHEYRRIAECLKAHGRKLHITAFGEHQVPECSNVVCYKESIAERFPEIARICLLDSEAPETLSPEDASHFDYFLLGGILGNVDEFDFDRTSVLRACGYPRRNLGAMQMTTDTAAIVTSRIIHAHQRFDQLAFIDRPEFDVDGAAGEKLVMNFRYLAKADGVTPDIDENVLKLAIEDRDFTEFDHLE